MNTTGRSESINAFFDAFVASKTNLKEFVVKYEQALEQIVKKESDEDFESEHKYRIVNDNCFLLKHASKLYTRNMFKKFEKEWDQVNQYKIEEGGCDNEYHIYLVKTKLGEPEEFVVNLNLQTYEGMCECQNFEFVGILCRHMLKVFVRLDIDTIPAHFILARWRQEANKFRVMDSTDDKKESEALRLFHMYQESNELARMAAPLNEAYRMYMETMSELSKKLTQFFKPPVNVDDQFTNELSQLFLLDPHISQTKGRKKDVKGKEKINSSDRFKSSIELALNKKKRKCTLCEKFGHDKRNCLLNPNRKMTESTNQISKNKEIQELGQDMESDHEE